jgi:TRAP-type uncharacterized transport system substrate-binding protein
MWMDPPLRRRALWALAVVATLAATWILLHFVSPAPPRSIAMSTGMADGAYHQFGVQYRKILRDNGIELELRPSSGAVENLRRLEEGAVSAAFVQGGLGVLARDPNALPDSTPLRSLATVAFEPVWIFTQSVDVSKGLDALAGKRIAVGVAGSGNFRVAAQLLALYGVVANGGDAGGGTQFVEEGGLTGARMLERHEIDAVIIIAAAEAPAVRALLANPANRLASLEHVQGIARRFPYFRPVSLKRGSVDPRRDLPPRDIELLATTANLVVRDELHPALAYLLLEAARQVHKVPSLVNRPDEFPTPTATDFPLADEAERYFRSGRPFLQNVLPFWLANLVQRLVLLLLPVVAILFPLANLLPRLVEWRRQARLNRRYGELKFYEADLASRHLSAEQRREARVQLDTIESEIVQSRFPIEFADRVYTLRQHLDYVRTQLERQAGGH